MPVSATVHGVRTAIAAGCPFVLKPASRTPVGALIIGVLNNALNLMDVSSYYQMIAKGDVILLAVLVDRRGAQN